MLTITMGSNVEILIAALQKQTDTIVDQIQRGMIEGVRFFEGAAIKEFYTGRKGVFGLNVVTGTLRRGWLTKIVSSRDEFKIQLGNKVKYGPTHEFGRQDDNGFGKGIKITYKKRTDVTGKWKREGIEYLNKAVTKRLSQYVKIVKF